MRVRGVNGLPIQNGPLQRVNNLEEGLRQLVRASLLAKRPEIYGDYVLMYYFVKTQTEHFVFTNKKITNAYSS